MEYNSILSLRSTKSQILEAPFSPQEYVKMLFIY